MRKFNYASSILVVIFLPLMIVVLSSNAVLRMSETYVYHFYDTRAASSLGYNVDSSEFAKEIAGYWSSFDDEFQVYENNGDFSDPIFDDDEQVAMWRAKLAINFHLLLGIFCGIVGLSFYIYLYRRGFKKALRKRGFLAAGITAVLIVIQDVLLSSGEFQAMLYDRFIGVELEEGSALMTLLGSSFYKTYNLFSTILGMAILGIFFYIHFNITKIKHVFY